MASSDPPLPADPKDPIRPGASAPGAPSSSPGALTPAPGAPAPAPGSPVSEPGEEQPVKVKEEFHPSYPPFPKYDAPTPMSVADTIMAGRTLRAKNKAVRHDAPIGPMPKPAKPRRPKVTDLPMSRRETHAHTCCLRKHGAVLTDRLEYMAKPARRAIIYLWRDHADTLPPETIARLRTMLDADEPFKPDKAYDYFVNMRKSKRANKKTKINQFEKDLNSISVQKQSVFSRNATVAFARGVQERLRRPGRYVLADGYVHALSCFLQVAVWIDGVLAESDDHMLMMDFDDDVDLKPPPEPHADANLRHGKGGKASEPKSGEAKWVDAEAGKVPPDAVVGGQTSSGEPVYVVRAEHGQSLIPGNLVPSNGAAHVASGGGQQAVPKYQVLVGGSGKWQPASGPNVPADALPGGRSGTGEELYVGRAKHEGGVIVGMVSKPLGSLHIAFGGKEVAINDYEILMK